MTTGRVSGPIRPNSRFTSAPLDVKYALASINAKYQDMGLELDNALSPVFVVNGWGFMAQAEVVRTTGINNEADGSTVNLEVSADEIWWVQAMSHNITTAGANAGVATPYVRPGQNTLGGQNVAIGSAITVENKAGVFNGFDMDSVMSPGTSFGWIFSTGMGANARATVSALIRRFKA